MISSPSRLAILAVLVPGPPVCFAEMKAATGLADGNLHVQTHKLADAGYLQIDKAVQLPHLKVIHLEIPSEASGQSELHAYPSGAAS